jgi:leader peptidase (prepilin peptidase)/N-methyltransferase
LILLSFLVFLFGLAVGSFLNVCIYRIYRGESVIFPPSRCPGCGRRLGAAELLPVVSYLLQRGRCKGCGGSIHWRYALVELLTGLIFVVLLHHFPGPEFLLQAFLYSVFIVVFFIDLDHQVIPNRLVVVLMAFALAVQVFRPALPWGNALLGMLAGGGFLLFLAVVSRGGMGGGDVKLMAALGFWYGWQQTLLLLFLAFVAGGLTGIFLLATGLKKRKDPVPFGPFLVLAALVAGLWGQRILDWYMRW